MTDTPSNVERIYRERLLALSPAERWMRGALMFDAARAMALASFPADLSPEELRKRLKQRFYPELKP